MDIKELFENKMNLLIILLVIAFFVFGILLIVRIRAINKTSSDEKIPVVVDSNMLYLLEEPLQIPPVQFSRKQRKQWRMLAELIEGDCQMVGRNSKEKTKEENFENERQFRCQESPYL